MFLGGNEIRHVKTASDNANYMSAGHFVMASPPLRFNFQEVKLLAKAGERVYYNLLKFYEGG